MTAASPIHRASMEDLAIDYGYLCDLARVNGWHVALKGPFADGRHALRVVDGAGVVLAGVRFPLDECRLDDIAETVFAELHREGVV